MTSTKQINDEQLNITPKEIPVGCLQYQFYFDRHINPNLVIFRVYAHDGDQLFGARMPLQEWNKFVALVNDCDLGVQDELNKIIPLSGLLND